MNYPDHFLQLSESEIEHDVYEILESHRVLHGQPDTFSNLLSAFNIAVAPFSVQDRPPVACSCLLSRSVSSSYELEIADDWQENSGHLVSMAVALVRYKIVPTGKQVEIGSILTLNKEVAHQNLIKFVEHMTMPRSLIQGVTSQSTSWNTPHMSRVFQVPEWFVRLRLSTMDLQIGPAIMRTPIDSSAVVSSIARDLSQEFAP